MTNMDVKSFANADEVKNPDKTLAQIINFGDVKIKKTRIGTMTIKLLLFVN